MFDYAGREMCEQLEDENLPTSGDSSYSRWGAASEWVRIRRSTTSSRGTIHHQPLAEVPGLLSKPDMPLTHALLPPLAVPGQAPAPLELVNPPAPAAGRGAGVLSDPLNVFPPPRVLPPPKEAALEAGTEG